MPPPVHILSAKGQNMALARARMMILALTLASATIANARELTKEEKSCAFKNTVVVGASITAQTAITIPLYHKMISALAIPRGHFLLPNFGPSPVNLFMNLYSGQGWGGNHRDLSRMFTKTDEDLGSAQIETLLTGQNRNSFLRANTVFGIDAFYWDAVYNQCGFGNGFGVEETIKKLIQQARANHTNLVLGNVPHENPNNVLIDSETLGIDGLWYKPEDSCVSSINETLKVNCRKSDGCYIIDMEKIVSTLNSGGTLQLQNGQRYSLYQIRPDGVHLSVYGSKYIQEQIIEALESAPPNCR